MQTARLIQWLGLMGIYVLGWQLQENVLFNSDVSWLTEGAKRIAAGQHYATHFFEINPPMILYVYMPVIGLTTWFGCSTAIALRVYVFLLSTLSLWLCRDCLKQIRWSDCSRPIGLPDIGMVSLYHNRVRSDCSIGDTIPRHLVSVLMLVIAMIFLLLPINEFGQREPLVIVLSLPYFLLLAVRLSGKHGRHLGLIGILAGIGFAIKPYFLVAFVITEGYFLIKKRSWLAWLRHEVMGIIAVMLLYAIVLVVVHQDYLRIVLPVISQQYYQSVHSPVRLMWWGGEAVYVYVAFIFYVLRVKQEEQGSLANILMLAMVGFFIGYLIQCNYWYYHAIPMLSMAILLCVWLFLKLLMREAWSMYDRVSMGLFTLMALLYGVVDMNRIAVSVSLYPTAYFSLYALVLSCVLFIKEGGRLYQGIALGLAVGLTVLIAKSLDATRLHGDVFLITNSLFFLWLFLLVPNPSYRVKLKAAWQLLIGLLLFYFPFYELGTLYSAARAYKVQYMHLVHDLAFAQMKSVYFFTDTDQLPYPALDINHQSLGSRFSSFASLPSIDPLADDATYRQVYQQYKQHVDFYADAVADDFERYHPAFVFVDSRRENKATHLHYYGGTQIDYRRLFLLNARFKKAWRSYHYLKTIDGQPVYRFEVYQFWSLVDAASTK